jgi:hypothetical protein
MKNEREIHQDFILKTSQKRYLEGKKDKPGS